MLVKDLIRNNNFDCNCNYEIYDCTDRKNTWGDGAKLIFSTAKDGYDDPPDEILDMEVAYITTNNNAIVIEAASSKKAYYITYAIEARYVVKVRAKSLEEAMKLAEEEYLDADFGEAEDIDGEPIIVEDSDGNYVWEKD